MKEINKQELFDKITTLGKAVGFLFVIYVFASLVNALLVGSSQIFVQVVVQATIFSGLWFVILSNFTDLPNKVYRKAILNIESVKSAVLSASAILIAYFLLSVVVYALLNGGMREHNSPLADAVVQSPVSLLIGIIFMFVFVGVSEELLFRAGVYEILKKDYSVKSSAIISSLMFGVLHITALQLDATSVFTVLATGSAGFVFALIYERTDNIVVPIIAHGVFNSLLLILIYIG